MIGRTISHFRVTDRLGGGGMGVVYSAEDVRLQRRVALKFLPPHLSNDDDAKARFFQEARAASALEHENICTILDVGQTDDGQLWIAMPHYEGETLKKVIERGPVPLQDAVRIVTQIAEGLNAAHERGIVHRDIKPANILLTDRGRVVILDFGLAKLAGSLDLTRTGTTLGTAFYMSPEQIRGDDLDFRSDLWALTVVLFEMLEGRRPFEGTYDQALAYAILNEDPDLPAELPDSVLAVLRAGLRKDREFRTPDFAGLSALLSASNDAVRLGAEADGAAARRISRSVIAAAAAIPVLLVALAVWALSRDTAELPVPDYGGDQAYAVLPFVVEGADELAYLSNGMVRLLSAALDGIPATRAVDPNAILAPGSASLVAGPSSVAGIEISKKFGASGYILGSVLRVGPTIRITATLYDGDGVPMGSGDTAVASDSLIIEAVDAITTELLADRMDELAGEVAGLAAHTTSSVSALRDYLAGEEAMRALRLTDAEEYFGRAVAADSTFAMAWLRLADVVGWSKPGVPLAVGLAKSDSMRRIAHRHDQRLSWAYRQLIDAQLLRDAGRAREGLEVLEQIVARHPDNILALMAYGEALYHYNAFQGQSPLAAVEPLSRVLELDPGLNEARSHLAGFVAQRRDYVAGDSLIADTERWGGSIDDLAREGTTEVLSLVALAVSDSSDSPRKQWATQLLGQLSDERVRSVVLRLIAVVLDPASARAVAALRPGPAVLTRSNEYRLELAEGRTSRFLSDALLDDRLYGFDLALLSGTLVWYPYDAGDIERVRTRALELPAIIQDIQVDALRRLVLGLAAWRLGDSAALSKVVEGLASARPTDPEDNLLLIVERTLNALRLRDAGDPGAALASLKGAMVPVTLPNHWRDLYSQTIPRYLYAELLRESGRYREAIPWFASVNEGPHKGPGFPLYFPGLLRRAQCYEQLGEFEEAISAYTRFVELWRNGDPEVMPMVEEAQDRLDALVELRIGEPTS